MKITKQQLKQIVKEEIPKILSEASPQSELGLPHKFDNKELYKIGRQQWRDPDSQLRTDREYAAKFVAQISNKLRKGGASPGLEALRHDIESSFTPSLDTLQSRRHAKDQKFRPQSRLRQRTGAYSSRSPGPDEPLSVYEDMKITKSQLKQIIKEEISKIISVDDLYLAEMFDTTSAGTAHTPTGTTQLSPAQEACKKATNGKGVLRPDGCFLNGTRVQLEEELTKALNEQEGTFTYNVIKDEFDGGPRVDIEGINRTFAQMMQDLDGKEIDDEWEGPWTFKLENFREHEEEDVDDLLNSIIVDSAPGDLIEAWAKMNGLEARRIGESGGHF